MRKSHLARTVALVPLALAMSAGAALAAGNPCDPHTYGAVGNGTIGTNNGTLNTIAIQAAIDACAAAGGGIVPISKVASGSVYLTGPIQLKSHVLLQVNAGATLLATTDEGQYSVAFLDYPMPVDSTPQHAPIGPYEALVFAYQAVDTGIIGTGTINGQGNVTSTSADRPAGTGTGANRFTGPSYIGTGLSNPAGTSSSLYSWWTLPPPATGPTINGTPWYATPQTDIPTSNGPARPWLIEFYQCGNVTVNGITLVDSPMWNMVFRYSNNITVSNYHVQNYVDGALTTLGPTSGPNTDGMDVVGSFNVSVSNINEQVGDDDVAIKSGLPLWVQSGVQGAMGSDLNEVNAAGVSTPAMASHDITVTNSTITGGHGISIGSEASNGVYNVHIQNINASGSALSEVLRIKTGRTRGSYNPGIHDITVQNMVANGASQPILVYDYYPQSFPPNETGFSSTPCTSTLTTNCTDQSQAIQANTPNVYNITISGLTATNATSPAVIAGVPEACILNVILNNVSVTTNTAANSKADPGATATFQLRNMTGTFTNVILKSTASPTIPLWEVDENVHVTETGGTPFPGPVTSVNTPPLTANPTGVPCASTPPA